MTEYERKRLKKLMEDKLHYYVVDQFIRFGFYDRAVTERSEQYVYRIDKWLNIYVKLIDLSGRPLEKFKFNADLLEKSNEARKGYYFKGSQIVGEFLNFYTENIDKVDYNLNQLYSGSLGVKRDDAIRERAIELIGYDKPKERILKKSALTCIIKI